MTVLTLKATPENLDRLIEFIGASLAPCGFSPSVISKAKIAGEEIFINICRYAYAPGMGAVEICSRRSAEGVVLEFKDGGRPFNPLSKEHFKSSVSSDALMAGGRGIFMAQNLVSDMSYRFSDGKNILTMIIKKE